MARVRRQTKMSTGGCTEHRRSATQPVERQKLDRLLFRRRCAPTNRLRAHARKLTAQIYPPVNMIHCQYRQSMKIGHPYKQMSFSKTNVFRKWAGFSVIYSYIASCYDLIRLFCRGGAVFCQTQELSATTAWLQTVFTGGACRSLCHRGGSTRASARRHSRSRWGEIRLRRNPSLVRQRRVSAAATCGRRGGVNGWRGSSVAFSA